MQPETIAQQALRLLEPIPADQWIAGGFTNGEDKCCALGHHTRLKSQDPTDYSRENCAEWDAGLPLRETTHTFLIKNHARNQDIADVNNYSSVNGYNEPVIKDRVIHLLKDMVAAGY